MGRTIFEVGIANESGTSVGVNASGQLAVETTVNVGAITVGVSGQTVYLAATEVSGTNPFVYITQSGKGLSGIPHKLVVGFSGETAIAKISGETVSVSNLSGTPVITSISGDTVIAKTSGETHISKISGESVIVTSGQVQVTSGIVVAKTSGETHISKISGETIIALISGQTIAAEVDLSGVTLNVDTVTTDISGQTVVAEVSGQIIRFGTSGFSYAQLQGWDYTNSGWVDVAVDESGVVAVSASVSAEISGDTVRIWQGSGHNGIYLTSQSGNIFAVLDDSGRLAVTTSGVSVGVVSGTGVRVSGETITVVSGTGVRVSGETITVNGTVAVTSGTGVRISGDTIVLTSGAGVRVSGETITVVSGTGVRVSGESVIVRSGQVQITSGIVVAKVSGETVVTTVSGNILTAANTLSGNVAVGGVTSLSGIAMLTAEPVKSLFVAYNTLPITALSGGTQLLSGDSRTVVIRNVGKSGTSMFIGSSGTNRAPWMETNKSGRGWRVDDGDSLTISINNPNLIRVVTLTATSGEPVTYAINNY